MIKTLLFRLEGPMQSWGTQSRFSIRDTGLEPSRSGVIGLLCAALGRPRHDTEILKRLAVPIMGVRADREGILKKDFHTALEVAKAGGGTKPTETSDRWYLSDASFLVGLESGDEELLLALEQALRRPRWQLFLGRKSFVPSTPIWLPDGLRDERLREALTAYLWQERPGEQTKQLRIVLETTLGMGAEVRQDVPLSFAERRFTTRYVCTDFIPTPKGAIA